ncbi:sugar phosphate isomerase/epimerase family protein [Rhodobium gokarnense]|uniref:Sugar phosphate isomerase/epimerase n=1 Tax=Rhodobium gokarnense TaxID=364296 RepID=A0ABT3HDS4_9HYPH|nr:sugar phosphate isomerase/epimerase [Rhodobium gokarnense]MCW2308431.1 sugar phosphate isomerase/epimerase [Rhodobium gokarnense]
MKLGVNLSFAVKRWLEPEALAALIHDRLGVKYVQYTWDLTDPWWPAAERDRLAAAYAKAFRDAGLVVESTFGGLASYTYNHVLAPNADLRKLGKEHLKRAIDMTAAMEVPATGMPFGSYSSADAVDPARREEILKLAEEAWVELAAHAAESGLEMLYVEPVPLGTEFPSTAADGLRLMQDLDGKTEVPVRLLVDWGHAMFEPLFGADANMDHWMKTCGDYIAAYHIQQTDGQLDRHWSFAQDGLLNKGVLEDFWKRYDLKDQTFFAEFVYPFEATDEYVLNDMVASMAALDVAKAA